MTSRIGISGAASLALAFVACGGPVDNHGSGSGPLGGIGHPNPTEAGADGGSSSTTSEGGAPAPEAHEGCGYPPGAIHPAPTEADFRAMFSRQWLSCGDPKITHTADEAGFEAHADGTFEVLVFDSAQHLVPNGKGGTYSLIPNATNAWQVDFTDAAGGLKVSKLTDSPRMLVMDEMGVLLYRYVPVDPAGWPEGSGPQPGPLGTWKPPASCASSPTTTLDLATLDFNSLIIGQWLLCSGDGVGPANPAQAGLQIDADGHYHVLMVDASGALVAATDISDAGTWTSEPNNLPYAWQLTLARDDALFMSIIVTVTDGPRMLQMSTGNGGMVTYIWAG